MTAAGRVAMVTGSGRGIGAAIAARLAQSGMAVAVCDVDAALAENTAAKLTADGASALGVPIDVSDSRPVGEAVARITAYLGPIQVPVNNAGIDKIEASVDST